MRPPLRLAALLLFLSLPAAAVAADFEQGYVQMPDGARLFYEKGGRGERTVIFPGRLFVIDDFRWLADDYTVIFYDMRNRGRSSFVLEGPRITFDADIVDLEEIRRHFGVERFSVMGYSYLGKIAALYALENPKRVERVVQLGPVSPAFGTTYRAEWVASDDPADPEARARLRKLRDDNYHLTHPREYCEKEWEVSRTRLVGDPANASRIRRSPCDMPNEWPTYLMRHMQHHFVESGQNHKVDRDRLARMETPVLVIHGTRDRNAPFGAGREWSYLLPNARLLTIERGAHQAFAEYPEVVMPAVRQFLRGQWPAGAAKVSEDPREK
jgi:proline iminopeptidase